MTLQDFLAPSIGVCHSLIVSQICRTSRVPWKSRPGSSGPPALTQVEEFFRRESGNTVKFEFGLSPVIHKRVLDGEPADVVIIQPKLIEELVNAGKLAPGSHPIVARVGMGCLRVPMLLPGYLNTCGFEASLLSADALVFNNVASGNYFATVLERLGIAEAVKDKVTRASPADVVTRIVQGKGTINDIGVGTITLILVDKRMKLMARCRVSYKVILYMLRRSRTVPNRGMLEWTLFGS